MDAGEEDVFDDRRVGQFANCVEEVQAECVIAGISKFFDESGGVAAKALIGEARNAASGGALDRKRLIRE